MSLILFPVFQYSVRSSSSEVSVFSGDFSGAARRQFGVSSSWVCPSESGVRRAEAELVDSLIRQDLCAVRQEPTVVIRSRRPGFWSLTS